MGMEAKNRAYLRGLGAKIKSSLNLGKGEVDESFVKAFSNALRAHELVKIRVLQNSDEEISSLSSALAERCECEIVAITGKTALFFKQNEKNPIIKLPR